MARALLAAALFGRTLAQERQLTTYASIAGYVPHSKIDLDMEEIVDAVGLGTAAGITEAIRIYTDGGGGLCLQTDVDAATAGTATTWCTDTTKALGNSQKSSSVRTIKGFATSGQDKMTGWTTYPVYKAYYNDYNYADTFITNAATHTNTNADDQEFREQMIKKGAAYTAVQSLMASSNSWSTYIQT